MAVTDLTIGEIVAKDHRAAAILQGHGIDFCCGGKRPFVEACAAAGVDPTTLARDIDALEADPPAGAVPRFDTWDLDFLMDYIVGNHHTYVRSSLPILTAYTQKVAKVHGDNHPELHGIAEQFLAIRSEMEGHMAKEEEILFPYIRELLKSERGRGPAPASHFGSAAAPIAVMEAEHESAGAGMARIAQLSANYTPPEDACATYRVCYAALAEFERDLHQHVHLENNILFPKALQLEEQLERAYR